MFSHLFQPLTIKSCRIKNRILSTGHDTVLPKAFVPNDELIAYHQARAAGGCGLIVVQVAGIHPTARYTGHMLMADRDDCIPGYRRLVEACRPYDCRVFGQVFHPGREVMESLDGSAPVAYAPSAIPNERFHVMPRPLSRAMIGELVAGYAEAAARLAEAGLDGIEIVASHGYLPAQFLNPRVNRREDDYGGTPENRRRFLGETIAAIRARIAPEIVLGLRISGEEKDADGLTASESLETIAALATGLDYVSVVAGSSASFAGAVHIVPPMAIGTGYVAPFAAAAKAAAGIPIFVAGRINQPQIAERILAEGAADMIGMTRAMICDPEMPNKAKAGKTEDIRACIACNQACIGHFHLGFPISCIQHPETGRELRYGKLVPARRPKRVLVAGGGPAGMKAAAIAASRGHDVTLHEAEARLGGQTLLAQALPGRAEFGGIVGNLAREMELAGVKLRLKSPVTRALVESQAPDTVILATGARPRLAAEAGIESGDGAAILDPWQVLRGERNIGRHVVIADWRCDWIGLGLAEKLARDGCRVRLCVDGYMAGQRIHSYVRDLWVGELHKLGVEIHPYARLYGIDGDSVYFQHATSHEPIVFSGIDTLIASLGHARADDLETALADWPGEVHAIGDCLTPRTAEEAVLEGLRIAAEL